MTSTRLGPEPEEIRDRCPPPRLVPGHAIVGTYVDNVHTFGAQQGVALSCWASPLKWTAWKNNDGWTASGSDLTSGIGAQLGQRNAGPGNCGSLPGVFFDVDGCRANSFGFTLVWQTSTSS